MPSDHAPHHSPAVLVLIDVINHFEFPDGEKVLRQALRIAPRLARLKKRARAAGFRQAIEHIRMMTNAGVASSESLRLNEIARAARR